MTMSKSKAVKCSSIKNESIECVSIVGCEFAIRCESKDAGHKRCTGTVNHNGPHWYYDELGRYRWWQDTDNNDSNIVGGVIPFSHPLYVAPEKRFYESYIGAAMLSVMCKNTENGAVE